MRKIIVVLVVLCAKIAQAQIYIDSYRFAGELPPLEVEYLIVGGGGGGGFAGGGGGAGGVRYGSFNPLIVSTNYIVTVGNGGPNNTNAVNSTAGNGQSSVFNTLTSAGGGGGGSASNTNLIGRGANGGSGGGSAHNIFIAGTGNTPITSPTQGYNGGSNLTDNDAGGGGGAGQAGQNGNGINGGNGGNGYQSSITGTATYYGGGGGGWSRNNTAGTGGLGGGGNGSPGLSGTAQSGTVNTGGGGGSGWVGGSGGSGVVILRYPSTYTITNPGGGLTFTTTTVGSNKVTTFTSGTGNIQFN